MPLTGDAKREYQRKWLARRKAEWFAGQSCIGCGATDRLELDHIDPDQKISHRVWSWSQERREAELAKCQVLCYACHKTKTAQYVNEIRSYEYRELCDRGHPLARVGMYAKSSGSLCCRYCQHLANAALRGGQVTPLDEWVKRNGFN